MELPIAIPLWKAAPALAFGNGVVLKPSPDAMGCASAIAKMFARLIPQGLFQVVHGGAQTGSALVDAVDGVSFNGSVAVGRQVAIAAASGPIATVLPARDVDDAAIAIANQVEYGLVTAVFTRDLDRVHTIQISPHG